METQRLCALDFRSATREPDGILRCCASQQTCGVNGLIHGRILAKPGDSRVSLKLHFSDAPP